MPEKALQYITGIMHTVCFLLWYVVAFHDDVIKWKHFPRYGPFVRRIHQWNSPHKGQWRGALIFSFIWTRMNGCVNNQWWGWWFETPSCHYDVIVMYCYACYAFLCTTVPWQWSNTKQRGRCIKWIYHEYDTITTKQITRKRYVSFTGRTWWG